MTHKLIKDIDEETWKKFIVYCKLKNIKAGDELNKILGDFIKKNLGGLLK